MRTDKTTLWVAQVAYKARMADIKAEIQEEEEKFKSVSRAHHPQSARSSPSSSADPSIPIASPDHRPSHHVV